MFERETLISEIRRQNFHMTNVDASLYNRNAAICTRNASDWESTYRPFASLHDGTRFASTAEDACSDVVLCT